MVFPSAVLSMLLRTQLGPFSAARLTSVLALGKADTWTKHRTQGIIIVNLLKSGLFSQQATSLYLSNAL